jgi:hypothetical protein
MPFTFSHPAIVLPLKKISGKTLSLTGLVIGSMTPDFEYFIRMRDQSHYSHSVPGIFWFDLPLGILLAFIYHQIVRDQLISNLPEVLNRKLSVFKQFNWVDYFKRNWAVVIISILIGAASHLLWDSFTHRTGYFVRKIVWLQKIIVVTHIRIHVYSLLQHLSTLTGGIIVIWAIFSFSDGELDQSSSKYKYWLSVSLITVIIFSVRFITSLNIHLYGDVVVSLISAFLIGLILTPFLIRKMVRQ